MEVLSMDSSQMVSAVGYCLYCIVAKRIRVHRRICEQTKETLRYWKDRLGTNFGNSESGIVGAASMSIG